MKKRPFTIFPLALVFVFLGLLSTPAMGENVGTLIAVTKDTNKKQIKRPLMWSIKKQARGRLDLPFHRESIR